MTATTATAITLSERVEAVLPVLRDHARRVDTDAVFPVEPLRALRRSGLMGLLVPTGHGGLGGGLDDLVRVAADLSGACLSTGMIWAMHCQQVAALAIHGGPELRARLLPRLAAGEVYIASVTSEKVKGGHLLTARAPLHRDEDGIGIDRDAPIVTGGSHADGFLMTMRDDAAAHDGEVSLVYADREQLTATPAENHSWDPMGMRGTHSGPLHLSGRVDETALVGGRGGFRDVALRTFVPVGHIAWAACWLGAARAALRAVVELVRSPAGRKQFDVDSELLRSRLARVRLDLDTTAALLAQVVRDTGLASDPEAPDVQLRLNGLKVHAAERSFAVVDALVEVVGLRHGYLRDGALPLERLFRDLRSASLNYANDRLLAANGALVLVDRSVGLAL
ncbi:acyl-CoA dehydrogenase family protein [Umezawaea sp. Da 62-37]|uniref:acyl-CoA dehydrogenase family protein n=1 Tax=Umezawaea sp. Da 62-37 TaxID=3075927 RepID=UPI0028F6E965|nr:acyl-CoA dehydrogenase family protein [Umezawaea sp. Da 62-37]WNV85132.1 acyl-CoA dehydrogenase family protein [Umezawaea sp. Da 62-37]